MVPTQGYFVVRATIDVIDRSIVNPRILRSCQLSLVKDRSGFPLAICLTHPPRFPNAMSYFSVILVGENGCNLPNNLKDA